MKNLLNGIIRMILFLILLIPLMFMGIIDGFMLIGGNDKGYDSFMVVRTLHWIQTFGD